MSSIFNEQESFGGRYSRIQEERLSDTEKQTIDNIKVVERYNSENGETFKAMCFVLKSGQTKSFYINNRSNLEVGDVVDPNSVNLYVLKDNETGELLKPRAEGEPIL